MVEASGSLPRNLAANAMLSRWIGFESDGEVRLSPGKVEIGQGILTALAQIAADELDVGIQRIRMLPADTATSPNEEVTSGSLSVQDSGMAIRHVAAEVRSLMLDAAALRLDLRPDQLSVEDGLIRGPQNRVVSYWELARDVSLDRPATAGAIPKLPAARRIAGTSCGRLDIGGRVTGERGYIHDIMLPGMRQGRVVRPNLPGRALAAVDETAFRKSCPGVQIVRDGSFLGVVADSECAAEIAAETLVGLATWADDCELPAMHDLPGWFGEQPHATTIVEQRGEMPEDAGKRIARSYAKPFIAHASIGPSCAIAEWRGGNLEVTSHTQGIFNLQRDLALVFALPVDAVHVTHAEGAGCYGHNGADDVALDAALLARATGGPVRVQWSRADELTQSPFGAAMRIDLAAGLDADGRITCWEHVLYSNGHVARPGRAPTPALLAAFSLDPPVPRIVAGDPPLAGGGGAQRNSLPLYDLPNMLVRQHRVLTTPIRTSSLRSLGAYGNIFAIESFMDELALEAGEDPLAFRLRHLSDERAKTVLEAVAAMAGWDKVSGRDGQEHGLAFARYKNTGGYCAVIAEVNVERDPRVTQLWIAADVGEVINPDGVANQIEGGAIQSVSWTLKEEVRFSHTALETGSWASYPILRFSEVPAVSVRLIDRPEAPPLGAGECAQGPTAAAIANGIHAALGVRIRQTPITRDRIISELEKT